MTLWIRVLIALMYDLLNTIETFLSPLKPVLRHLDLSLFQNVIIGILAIFIPFAIVLLTDILDSKKPRGKFEKMVLTEEVFGVQTLFWLCVGGIFFLSFFANGKEGMSIYGKLFAIAVIVLLTWFLWKSFSRVLRFSAGHKHEFEISFLQNLQLPQAWYYSDNKSIKDKMLRAWQYLWQEEVKENEREFTEVFVNHIDEAIEHKDESFATNLADIYKENLVNRDIVSVSKILPSVLGWTKQFWFDDNSEHKGFFLWELFPDVARKILLSGKRSIHPYNFFADLEKHIKEENLRHDNNEPYWDYVQRIFSSFLLMIFENFESFDERRFPKNWKITGENSKNHIPRIVFYEFFDWFHKYIDADENSEEEKTYRSVARCLFPNVDRRFFSVFLPLYYYNFEIKEAIVKTPPMIFSNPRCQEQETVDIVFDLFEGQGPFSRQESDFESCVVPNWENLSKQEREVYIARIQKQKLQQLLEELETRQMKEFCQQDEMYEGRRKQFAKSIDLLIKEASKRATLS